MSSDPLKMIGPGACLNEIEKAAKNLDDYVVVPREPTKEMIGAGIKRHRELEQYADCDIDIWIEEVFKAMIVAQEKG